ncbi:MAG: CCA tRNA nucleotidyltransferase [Alphaproteobacteria bacterium]|nr:CCA tRNA nucleotidyltransferase [Alphaproteobacteria bacterium]
MKWFEEPGLAKLTAAIEASGGSLRLVGGCVRDYVMGRSAKELDAATTLTPDVMSKVAQAAGFKVIPTGIDHGTVTIVLPERTLEVTTLRKDTACDGRHAEVAYTNSWEEDAARRDFTINALYMDKQGTIYDYHHGKQDIATHSVRFIGDASQRIEEDGLRILRFYRFLATHGKASVDADAQEACIAKRAMLAALSGERIAQEMRKLLTAANPLYSLEQMHAAEIDTLVTHASFQLASMPLLMACEQREHLAPDWAVRLLAIIDVSSAQRVTEYVSARWKLSNKDADALRLLAASILLSDEDAPIAHKRYLRVHGRAAYIRLLMLSAAHGLLSRLDPWLTLANTWVVPEFPVTSKALMDLGYQGKALGDALRQLEQAWEASEYMLDAEALLKTIA